MAQRTPRRPNSKPKSQIPIPPRNNQRNDPGPASEAAAPAAATAVTRAAAAIADAGRSPIAFKIPLLESGSPGVA